MPFLIVEEMDQGLEDVSDKRFDCTKTSYDRIIGRSNQFDEYEIFQVINKY